MSDEGSGPGPWPYGRHLAGAVLAGLVPPPPGYTVSDAARILGYVGGIQRTAIKAITSRENGMLGGRPPGS